MYIISMSVGEKVYLAAIRLLKRKKVPYVVDKVILDYFYRGFSSRPSLKPYHIDYPNMDVFRLIVDRGLVLYVEPKYDGTHIQFSVNGIFKHNGDPISNDQLAGILHICYDNPVLIKNIVNAVEEGYILETELFGKYYTPRGFHLEYSKLYDLTVFEIGFNGGWIPPPRKYEVLESLNLPYPTPVTFRPKSMDDMDRRFRELASREYFFEGIVVKANIVENIAGYRVKQFLKNDLIIFKMKVKESRITVGEKKRKVGKMREKIYLSEALMREIRDEIDKIYYVNREIFMSPRNIPRIISMVMNYLREAHPELLEETNERMVKKYIGSEVLEKIRGH